MGTDVLIPASTIHSHYTTQHLHYTLHSICRQSSASTDIIQHLHYTASSLHSIYCTDNLQHSQTFFGIYSLYNPYSLYSSSSSIAYSLCRLCNPYTLHYTASTVQPFYNLQTLQSLTASAVLLQSLQLFYT